MHQLESFFWGIVAALGALVIELTATTGYSFFTDPYGDFSVEKFFTLPVAIIGIAAIEEFFKYLLIAKKVEYLSLERSYVVNSLFFGLGFAAAELFLIRQASVLNAIPLSNLVGIAIIHMSTASLIGYRIATKNPSNLIMALTTLSIATALHSVYNILLTMSGERIFYVIGSYTVLLVFIPVYCFMFIKSRLAE